MYVIPPIVGGVYFQTLYHVFTGVLYYCKKPHYVMYASISSGILNVFLNYIFISKFGYIAAGYTTLVCYALQALMDYVVSYKIIGQNIYDMKFISVLSSAVIAMSIFSNLLYCFNFIRYILISLFLIVFFIRRQNIIGILRSKI